MVDKAKDDRPTTAKALEELARQVLDDECKKYLKVKEEDSFLPVELKEKDFKGLKDWYEKVKDEVYKSDLKKKYPEKAMNVDMRDYSFEIVKWLSEEKYPKSLRVGKAEILLNYLKYLIEVAKESVDHPKPTDDQEKLEKALKALKGAKADYAAMMKTPTGNYKFYYPKDSICKPNLFNTRKFIGQEVKGPRGRDKVRLMHWNILADGLAGSGLGLGSYAKSLEKQFASPKECLIWDYRKWLILEEIAHYEPDIITLVELDSHQDYDDKDPLKETKGVVYRKGHDEESKALQYYLEKIGYAMEYKSRKAKFAEQGAGIFWKIDKLKPISYTGKDDKKHDLLSSDFGADGDQIFTLMRFDQIDGGKKLAVSALHLQSDKKASGEDDRAKQIWKSLYWLNYKKYTEDLTLTMTQMNVLDKDGNVQPFEAPQEDLTKGVNIMDEFAVIIAGDFNAERKMSISETGTVFRPLAVSAPYFAGFKSFYDEIYHGDLPWTSWKRRPAGRTDKYAIDYVFGSKGKTNALAVLGQVPDDKVDPTILLPNYESGSDHISMVVDFELVDPPKPFLPEDVQDQQAGGYGIWIGVGGAIAVVVISILCWMFLGPEKRRKAESSSTSVD